MQDTPNPTSNPSSSGSKPNASSELTGPSGAVQSVPDLDPASGGLAGPQARVAAAGGGKESPPTNRDSYNCNQEGVTYFQPLRWGIDSLYLSYKGQLDSKVEDTLKKLKVLAQSQNPEEVALAQYQLGQHRFEVKDKGTKMFPYILADNAFSIQCPKSTSKAMPMAYVQISSGLLSARKPEDIQFELCELVNQLGTIKGSAKVSRIDLFVDFVSSVDMESWNRNAWVTRASAINTYSVDGKFSGWTIGAGSSISCRLYDKTLEILKSGKTYLYPLWKEGGWNGQDRVWRLEFQLKTDILGQVGFRDFYQVLDHLGSLWSYATTEWLKLTVPSETDQTRSRWPIHPLWFFLADVDFGDDGVPLSRTYSETRAPQMDWLMQNGLRAVTSYMAVKNEFDFDTGLLDFGEDLRDHHENEAYKLGLPFDAYVREKVSLKVRQYNTAMNADRLDHEELERRRIQDAAEAYRRESNG